MSFLKTAAVSAFVLIAAVSSAQQKFPLRSGEWEFTSPNPMNNQDPPIVMPFCLNDELWTKALNKSPSCTFQNLNITSSGGSYNLDCPMKTMQMKGRVTLIFDGMTHMTSKATFDVTANGQTNHMDSTSEWHWKGPTCNPDVDMNLKFGKH